MPVVLPTSTFQNGQLLDPSSLNKAQYDTEFPATLGENGIYSAGNGGIDQSFLSPDFSLRQEHLQPGQVAKSRAAGAWSSLDNMSDVTGRSTATSPRRTVAGQALPGCGVRVHVPFDATAIRWNVSFFWHVLRWWGIDALPDPDTDQAQDIITMVFVDGINQKALRREYPLTWFKRKITTVADQKNPYSIEAEQCAHWNLSHLQTVATTDDSQAKLSPGWHEVYMGFYVKPIGETYVQTNVPKYNDAGTNVSMTLSVHQRLSIGCRSARVVAFR